MKFISGVVKFVQYCYIFATVMVGVCATFLTVAWIAAPIEGFSVPNYPGVLVPQPFAVITTWLLFGACLAVCLLLQKLHNWLTNHAQ